MNIKNKFCLGIWIGIISIVFILGIVSNFLEEIPKPFFLALCIGISFFFIYSIGIIILMFVEKGHIKKYFTMYKDDIDRLLEFSMRGKKRYWVYASVASCELQLGICYLLKNDLSSAEQSLLNFSEKSTFKYAYYPNFILAILKQDMKKANSYYKSLLSIKSQEFDLQKKCAQKILDMIETSTFDEELYLETNYPCIKDLCLKYKN